MVILKTQGLNHRFGDSTPLSFPDISLAPGERVLLQAPSGAGKTTLLSLISGVRRIQAGDIWLNGVAHTSLSSRALDRVRADQIGLIFQTLNLLPFLSGLDNALLPLKLAGIAQPADKQRALDWAAQLGLPSDMMTRKPGELSQGQQQRVAVLRALLPKPSLVLADEPTAALDPDSSQAFLELLFEQMTQTQALLMVSHDPSITHHFDRVISL